MSRLFKKFVLYLSMLAIPAQGFAASTILYCGPAHQHTMTGEAIDQSLAHGHANDFAADRKRQDQAAEALNSTGHDSSREELKFTSSDRGLAKAGELGAHDTSEYAACCALIAVTAAGLRFPPAYQAIERIASNQLLSIGFVTDGPRRPPRSLPA